MLLDLFLTVVLPIWNVIDSSLISKSRYASPSPQVLDRNLCEKFAKIMIPAPLLCNSSKVSLVMIHPNCPSGCRVSDCSFRPSQGTCRLPSRWGLLPLDFLKSQAFGNRKFGRSCLTFCFCWFGRGPAVPLPQVEITSRKKSSLRQGALKTRGQRWR